MPRRARKIENLPEDLLEAAAEEFQSWALKALEGLIPNQRELADRLGWSPTTLSSALKRLTMRTFPQICHALGRDPVAELAKGRDLARKEEEEDRERAYRDMLEHTQADTMIALAKKLSPELRQRVVEELSAGVLEARKAD